MKLGSVFKTTTKPTSPLDGSATDEAARGTNAEAPEVSEFLTVQSFANFALMTGALSAAWHALIKGFGVAMSAPVVPYALAMIWAVISIAMSWKEITSQGVGNTLAAIFVGVINGLVLAGAIIGTDVALADLSP